ncbi:hypothetical protein Syun_004448 [Stephania yunnanensis]|uniref:Uncharacterized protein n=1 Tax=Stephania yunnanensis TaxID=152371 RepID=A0AAP0L3H8_9MAGN
MEASMEEQADEVFKFCWPKNSPRPFPIRVRSVRFSLEECVSRFDTIPWKCPPLPLPSVAAPPPPLLLRLLVLSPPKHHRPNHAFDLALTLNSVANTLSGTSVYTVKQIQQRVRPRLRPQRPQVPWPPSVSATRTPTPSSPDIVLLMENLKYVTRRPPRLGITAWVVLARWARLFWWRASSQARSRLLPMGWIVEESFLWKSKTE